MPGIIRQLNLIKMLSMDLYSMIEAGGRMKFEVTGEDLCKFAEVLIEKAQQMKMRGHP